MLSKQVFCTIFRVLGMTWPGIEHRSPELFFFLGEFVCKSKTVLISYYQVSDLHTKFKKEDSLVMQNVWFKGKFWWQMCFTGEFPTSGNQLVRNELNLIKKKKIAIAIKNLFATSTDMKEVNNINQKCNCLVVTKYYVRGTFYVQLLYLKCKP